MQPKLITVRWEGNDSARYDGVVQQIATRHVFTEDMANTEVGKTVRIKWGGATWMAVVIQLPDDMKEHPAKAATMLSADGTDKNPAAKRQKMSVLMAKVGLGLYLLCLDGWHVGGLSYLLVHMYVLMNFCLYTCREANS